MREILGSHPVDVFASCEILGKFWQLGCLVWLVGWQGVVAAMQRHTANVKVQRCGCAALQREIDTVKEVGAQEFRVRLEEASQLWRWTTKGPLAVARPATRW